MPYNCEAYRRCHMRFSYDKRNRVKMFSGGINGIKTKLEIKETEEEIYKIPCLVTFQTSVHC